MTNATTEWICKHCHHVEERPDVIERVRKQELRERLILVGIVLVVIALIVFGFYMEARS